ncbi:MAG: restriction endonuclease subunit S [Leptothrix sp. (in: b-proteobacteria)]
MSSLPKGWAQACLPDLISHNGVFIDGDWIESKDQDPSGDVRLIQLADIGDGRYVNKSNRFLAHQKAIDLGCTILKIGDVLIARMPDPLGRACIFPGDNKLAVTVVDVCVVRGQQEHFDRSWLMYFINSSEFRSDIHSLQSGSTRKRISRGNLSTLKLPIPPRAEQTRIVAKLEELLSDLDAGVAELKAAQKKLVQYRQSLLKAAVEGALTAEWRASHSPAETGAELLERILKTRRERWEAKQLAKFAEQGKAPPKGWNDKYPEPVKSDAPGLPDLPSGWAWASMDTLILDGPQNGLYLPASKYGTGTPILRIDDFQIGYCRPRTALNLVEATEDILSTYTLSAGDMVINRVNSMTHLGKSLVIGASMNGVLFESNMMRMNLADGIASDYVGHYLGSMIGRARLIHDAKWAVNQASINQQDVKRTPVPIPATLEQLEIVRLVNDQMSAIDQLGVSIQTNLKQSAAQRQNILKAAFSGQLVPQNPDDEPAEVLLARIRAERAVNTVKAARNQRSRKEPA